MTNHNSKRIAPTTSPFEQGRDKEWADVISFLSSREMMNKTSEEILDALCTWKHRDHAYNQR